MHTHAEWSDAKQAKQAAVYAPALLSLRFSLSTCGLVHQFRSLGQKATEILQLWQSLLPIQFCEPWLGKCGDYLLVNTPKNQVSTSKLKNTVIQRSNNGINCSSADN